MSSLIDRFKSMCRANSVQVVDKNSIENEFVKLSYDGSDYFRKSGIGVVRADAANAQEGSVVVDVSDEFKLQCVLDVEDLYVLVKRDRIFRNAYEAYKNSSKRDYMLFVGGESKTADIEKQLVSGVQGAKKVIFVLE